MMKSHGEIGNSHTEDIYSNCIRSYAVEIRKLRSQLKVSNSECESHKKAAVKISQELAEYKQQNESYKKTVSDLNKQVANLNKTNDGIVEDANKEISKLNTELQESRKEIAQLKQKITEINLANKDLFEAREDCARRLADSTSECMRLRTLITETNEKLSASNHRFSELLVKYNEAKDTADSLTAINQKLQSQVSFNEHRYAEQSTFIEDLKFRVISLEENVKNSTKAQTLLNERDATIISLKDQISKYDLKCQAITDALKHAQDQLQSSRIYDQEVQTLREQHQSLLKRAEDAEQLLRKYEQELIDKKEDYTRAMTVQSSTIEELQKQVIDGQQELDKAIRAQKKAEAEAESSKFQIDELTKSYSQLEETVVRIQDRIRNKSLSASDIQIPSPIKRVSFPAGQSTTDQQLF